MGTFGELVAGLAHADVQDQLLDPDLPHGVLLLRLGLLRHLLGHVVGIK